MIVVVLDSAEVLAKHKPEKGAEVAHPLEQVFKDRGASYELDLLVGRESLHIFSHHACLLTVGALTKQDAASSHCCDTQFLRSVLLMFKHVVNKDLAQNTVFILQLLLPDVVLEGCFQSVHGDITALFSMKFLGLNKLGPESLNVCLLKWQAGFESFVSVWISRRFLLDLACFHFWLICHFGCLFFDWLFFGF